MASFGNDGEGRVESPPPSAETTPSSSSSSSSASSSSWSRRALLVPYGRLVVASSSNASSDNSADDDSNSNPPPPSSPSGSSSTTKTRALLTCDSGAFLRSRRHTYMGKWEWKPRRVALLDAGALRRGVGAGSDDENGGDGDGVDDEEEEEAAILLVFPPASSSSSSAGGAPEENDGGGDDLPTGAIRLVGGGMLNSGDDGENRGLGFRLSVSSIPDHPLHVEVRILFPKESVIDSNDDGPDDIPECLKSVYTGDAEDGPRQKRKQTKRADETSEEAARYAWRLKFSDEGAAEEWREALAGRLKPRRGGGRAGEGGVTTGNAAGATPADGDGDGDSSGDENDEGGGSDPSSSAASDTAVCSSHPEGGAAATAAAAPAHRVWRWSRNRLVAAEPDRETTATTTAATTATPAPPPSAAPAAAVGRSGRPSASGGWSRLVSRRRVRPPPSSQREDEEGSRQGRRTTATTALASVAEEVTPPPAAAAPAAATTTSGRRRPPRPPRPNNASSPLSSPRGGRTFGDALARALGRALVSGLRSFLTAAAAAAVLTAALLLALIGMLFYLLRRAVLYSPSPSSSSDAATDEYGGAYAVDGDGTCSSDEDEFDDAATEALGAGSGDGDGASALDFVLAGAHSLLDALRRTFHEITGPSVGYAFDRRPPVEITSLRAGLAFLQHKASTISFGGGVTHWIIAVSAASVLAVSSASALNRAFPRLGSTLWNSRQFFLALPLLLAGCLLVQDTWANYLVHPLEYGLYWEGWVRALVGLGLAGGGGGLLRKALRGNRPPRRRMSAARKVSAGLSAVVMSLSVPLALRSVQEGRRIDYDDAAVTTVGSYIYAAASALSLFVGFYFFGRAVRHWTLVMVAQRGGSEREYPVGRLIHEASLLPARTLYLLLGICGDLLNAVATAAYHFAGPFWDAVVSVARATFEVASGTILKLYRSAVPFLRALRENVVRPFLEAVATIAVEAAERLAETWRTAIRPKLVEALDALGRTVNSVYEGVGAAVRSAYDAVLVPIGRAVGGAVETVLNLALRGLDAVLRFASGVVDAVVGVIRKVGRVLVPILHRGMERTLSALAAVRDLLRSVLTRYLYPVIASLSRGAMVVLGAFVKKVWQLAAAGLAFNASYRFAISAILTTGGGAAGPRAGFALGAWSLFVVGIAVSRAVLSSGDRSVVNQYIDVDDSALRHVDLYLGLVLRRLLTAGWHALSASLKLLLHGLDVAVRETAKVVWKFAEALYLRGIRPIVNAFRGGVMCVWNSPYVSMVGSIAALSGLYLHRTGVVSLPDLAGWWVAASSTTGSTLAILSDVSSTCGRVLSDLVSGPAELLANLYEDVYDPIVDVRATSPAAGLGCWTFLCLVKWTQTRFRTKLLAVPVVLVYLMEVTGYEAFRAFGVSYVLWVLLSFAVGRYEREQRRLASMEFDSFQRRQQKKAAAYRETKAEADDAFAQRECSICLEELHMGAPSRKTAELPCGHRFHEGCIRSWLVRSDHQRCPICRRATGGWDRVLEVVF